MSKPPLNYVHNIIQESVPVIIPFNSECEVVTSHPSANVRCDRNSNMITPTIKSNADSATNESNEWTLVEKKKTKKSNSNGGQTVRAYSKAWGDCA